MDRAAVEVDENFANAYEARRRHREVSDVPCRQITTLMNLQTRIGQPFWDPSIPQSHFAGALPDPLRIKPLGVQGNQAVVYEDFGTYFPRLKIS